MSLITTHVLDASLGRPAVGLAVLLEFQEPSGKYKPLARGVSGEDGRIRRLLPDEHVLAAGIYRLVFDTEAYFRARGVETRFPSITILFTARPGERYHLPIYVGPFSYWTYRGS